MQGQINNQLQDDNMFLTNFFYDYIFLTVFNSCFTRTKEQWALYISRNALRYVLNIHNIQSCNNPLKGGIIANHFEHNMRHK